MKRDTKVPLFSKVKQEIIKVLAAKVTFRLDNKDHNFPKPWLFIYN